MAKNLSPKCKLCRRAGEKLFLKGDRCNTPKCAMVKRNYHPGFHGSRRMSRPTPYGLQLAEKQKAKRQYGMLEKQFKITFEKAKKSKGNLGENFVKLLEMRFDNVIFKLGFAKSRSQARQLINHGHFTVNGRKLDIPSYLTRSGDEVAIKGNKKEAKIFKPLANELKQFEAPGWLNLDKKEVKGKVLHIPEMELINPTFNVQMIVEFYSR
ncbi:30S ribosomal protein S4 [bacterium]|nr:30S ribosomal protein S4 [bacterium]